MSKRPPISLSAGAPQILILLVIAVVIALANLLPHFQVDVAAGADSSGYINEARLIQSKRLEVAQPILPGVAPEDLSGGAFVPLGFRGTPAHRMVPTYPIGFPLMIAAAPHLSEWDQAAGPVVWGHALLALILMLVLADQVGLTLWCTLLAVLVLAASPVFLVTAEQALSDVPALAWCTATMAAAWAARSRIRWSVIAGFAFSVAVAVRPTNALIFAPLMVVLGRQPHRWIGFGLGALPGLVALALVQRTLYGSVLATGYGNVAGLFGREYLWPTLKVYAWAIPIALSPAVFLLFFLPAYTEEAGRRTVAALALWIAAFGGFYAFYFCTHEQWWYLRFLLPAFPALILAALLVVQGQLKRRGTALPPRAALTAGVLLLAWGLGSGFVLRIWTLPQFDRSYAEATGWMQRNLPPNAVVAAMQASGALYHDTRYPLLRYDLYAIDRPRAATLARVVTALADRGRSLYALLAPFEVRTALEKDMPGHWELAGVVGEWTVWRLADLKPTPVTDPAPRVLHRLTTPRGELTLLAGSSWYGIEVEKGGHTRDWSRGDSTLEVLSNSDFPVPLTLQLKLDSPTRAEVQIAQNGRELWVGPAQAASPPITLAVALKDGHATLHFHTDAPGVPEPPGQGGRQLKFAIVDPQLLADGGPAVTN